MHTDQRLGERADQRRDLTAAAAELTKHSADLDVELIRAKQAIKRLQKFATVGGDASYTCAPTLKPDQQLCKK